MAFQIPTVSIEEVLKGDCPVVDVRTPKEFAEFHIPGTVNLPIFTNEERVRVGTTYKQVGQDEAKELGLQFVSPKLADLYQQMKAMHEKEGKNVIIHCWRGGMRSGTIASLMNALGIPCSQLDGGIRSYRRLIMNGLELLGETLPPFIVLQGLTGTRKTDILNALEKEGYPTLDLEGMAGHRGSAFGAIGLTQNSQKQFESMLWQRLNELRDARYLIIEAESKRIGNVILPDFILKGKKAGRRIHMHYPYQKRIKSLLKDYQPEKHEREFRESVARIEKRIDAKVRNEVHQAMDKQDFFEAIGMLLEHYYDPMYQHAAGKYETPVIDVNMEDFHEGIIKVKQAIEQFS